MSDQFRPTSPLHAQHADLGAHFTDFAGWQMPLKYGSELAEHHTVRTAAGLFDLSHMGEIDVQGPGAGPMLDYALVGEISKIAVGRAKYSLLCTAAGGVIDDLVVYRVAPERYLVVANAANTAAVSAALTERAAGHHVTVADVSARTALIAVQGPAAPAIGAALVGEDQIAAVTELKYYAITPAVIADCQVLVARTGYTGEDGFELYVREPDAVTVWRAALTATLERGGGPAGLACRDTLRLEAGMALYGHELSVHTDPYAAGLGRVVALQKDFVGRDALTRLSQMPTGRSLVGLRGQGRRAARVGYRVCDGTGEHAVGEITSGALSPTLGYPIAMGYVDTELTQPGTAVTVDIRGRRETFTTTALPFYRRP